MRGLFKQSRYTIRQRLLWENAITGVLLLLVGGFAVWQINCLAGAVGALQLARQRAIVALQVHQSSTELIAVINRLLPLEDAAVFETLVTDALDELKQSHAALESLAAQAVHDETAYPQMNRVREKVNSVIGIADTMIRQARAQQWPSVRVRVGVLTRDHQQLAIETNKLVDLAAEMEQAAGIQVRSAQWAAVFYPALAILFTIGVQLLFSRWIRRGIARPIEQLTQGAAQLSAGLLDKRVSVEGSAELAQLATAFNQMAERLQALLAELEQRVAERTADLQRAMQELTQERNMLSATLNALPDLLFEVDRHGTIYQFQTTRPELLYRPPPEFLGRPLEQVLPLPVVSVIQSAIQQAADSGTVSSDTYTLETSMGEGWFELSIAPKGDPRAPDSRFIALARDITARVQAEQALRESEERYRTILETIEDGYYEVDLRGNFTFFNSAMGRILGYRPSEMLSMNNRQYMRAETAQKVYQTFNAVYKSGQPTKAIDWEVLRKDGIETFLETSITLMCDAQGKPIGFRGITRDVTERKRTELALQRHAAELQTRNEELDAFAHTVAHDLKTPLGYMVNYAEVLEGECDLLPKAELEDHIQAIARNGRKVCNIVDELMLLAEVRQVEDIKLDTLDMSGIVAEACKHLEDLIQERQAQIILPATWPAALGHELWIEQVWVNYISNAVKYGGQSPRVELGATPLLSPPLAGGRKGGRIRFWVRDNGPGLAPDEQARLFTPFTRLEQVRARGHGLGLSIVKRIVEKLGEQVGIESELGQGSTFWFTLRMSDQCAHNHTRQK